MTDTTSNKEIYVGAVIELNQHQVNLIPSTPINKIDTLGLKLSLDKPLELGKVGDAMDSICKDIGLETNPLSKAELEKIQTPLLKNVATKVADANMRIEALKYDQPAVKDAEGNAITPKPSSKYVFVASVNWKDDKGKSEEKDFFKLKGLIFGVSSGYTNPESGENSEVQDAFKSALQAMIPEEKSLKPALPAADSKADPKADSEVAPKSK